jgi:nucleoid-associated protein YgaU
MQRDLKIGLLAGLVIAGAAMVYICTRPNFSPKAQVLKAVQQQQNASHLQPPQQTALSIEDSKIPAEPVRQSESVLPVSSGIKTRESYTVEPKPSFTQPQIQPENYISTEKIKTTRFYIVRTGDTLSKISKNYYSSALDWHKIYQANRDVIKNPDSIKPGTKLIIPD